MTNLNNLSESETRKIIDEQLRQVGWEVDTTILRYSKSTRPKKGQNIAIAEWPTNSSLSGKGSVDYALFIDEKLIGLIEAKKFEDDISQILAVQCKDYACNIKEEHKDYLLSHWNDYDIPFIFASNGRKHHEKYPEKSGIWFRDTRDNANIAKALQNFPSPQGLLEWYEKDIDKGNESLNNLSKSMLEDESGLNLRYYQTEAIFAVEEALMKGAKTALLAMATGTGKTRTILGMIYRLLKSKRFNRILFLVDRNTLGSQALDVFNDVKLEGAYSLNKLYDIKELGESKIDAETKVQVATVQSLVKRIMYNTGEYMPSVADFDLIVVDEAHRGYILDKEMGDDEALYMDQDEFKSKYRSVLDYFEAVKVALTATPAQHTTNIFGEPVYTYSYRQAVVDGYLIDHDAPHKLKTQLSTYGIHYKKDEFVTIYDPQTGEVFDDTKLEDELHFDVDDFNKKVINENFNRAVLQEISKYIDPESREKTLIYAVNDSHADMIVRILQEIYAEYGIDVSLIAKITGKSGYRKHIEDLIKRYKNEQSPSIAVTVDLLTTGIDVPEITKLVFLRRVKSRILFEQMLGRATRLCPAINKSVFEIYDAVNIYDTLKDVNTMKPVVTEPHATFEDLIRGLDVIQEENKQKEHIEKIVAKLRRKLQKLDDEQRKNAETLANTELDSLAQDILSSNLDDKIQKIKNAYKVFTYLDKVKIDAREASIISITPDNLLSHERGYGNKAERPKDYLESFAKYINENKDKVDAIQILATRPQDLKIADLTALKLELDNLGYTEQQLNQAWKSVKNEDILADTISFVRSQVLDTKPANYEDRIKTALAKLKNQHEFTANQVNWLDKIETFLITEKILNEETFSRGIFKDKGGFRKLNLTFNNKLQEYIEEINNYLYEDKKAA